MLIPLLHGHLFHLLVAVVLNSWKCCDCMIPWRSPGLSCTLEECLALFWCWELTGVVSVEGWRRLCGPKVWNMEVLWPITPSITCVIGWSLATLLRPKRTKYALPVKTRRSLWPITPPRVGSKVLYLEKVSYTIWVLLMYNLLWVHFYVRRSLYYMGLFYVASLLYYMGPSYVFCL